MLERFREQKKSVQVLFILRMFCWITAASATLYWIWWSFHLYNIGIHDVHEYAENLRPVFGWGLFIALVSVIISFILRAISDEIKRQEKEKRDHDIK